MLLLELSLTTRWLDLVLSHDHACLQDRMGVRVFFLALSIVEKAKRREDWKVCGVYWFTVLPQQTFSW